MPISAPSHRTLDTTPLVIENFGPDPQDDEICQVDVFIFANDHTTGQAFWSFSGLLRRMPGGVMGGIIGEIFNRKTPAASAWSATVSVSAGGRLQATLTGGTDIVDWLVTTDDVIGMRGSL